MSILLRDGYSTTITDHTFTISDSQFGTDSQSFERFFGLGDDAGNPVGTSFQIGGPVIVNLPFIGDTEIFRAQINGNVAASFGLKVVSQSFDARLHLSTVAFMVRPFDVPCKVYAICQFQRRTPPEIRDPVCGLFLCSVCSIVSGSRRNHGRARRGC